MLKTTWKIFLKLKQKVKSQGATSHIVEGHTHTTIFSPLDRTKNNKIKSNFLFLPIYFNVTTIKNVCCVCVFVIVCHT